jgi:type IV pilus assembly protein PilW
MNQIIINRPARKGERRAGRIHQSGLSLIELLVGLTIGLLVVVASVGSLVYTRASSTTVGDASRLQQDAATAFRIIGHHLRQGGARRLQPALGGNVQFNPNFGGFGPPALPVVVQGTNGAATDTLQISHDADDNSGTSDCLGTVAASTVNNITMTFALDGQDLRCTGLSGTQPLVQGVEDLQVWYGIRTGALFQYQAAPATFDNVESVMVCLRMAGELASNPGAAVIGCNGENIANDGRIRRVFFRVFNIRNLGL